MRRNRQVLLAIALAAAATVLLLAAFVLLVGALVWSTLDSSERQAVGHILLPRLPLLLLGVVAAVAVVAALLPALFDRWIGAPARLLEQVRVVLTSDSLSALPKVGAPAAVQGLAESINQLAAQRNQLKTDMTRQVAAASFGIEQERKRLAALMGELQQSVVVCNLDGRILLYNNRARLQFRALSKVPNLADGAELMGLGRSIYAVFDRKLVAHALERVQQQMQRGALHPSAQLVTATPSGQLLRARMAAVRVGEATPAAAHDGQPLAIDSFVLLLDNITDQIEQQAERERLLHGLTEGHRGSLANLSTAVELLDDPELEPPMRERLLEVVREETQAMARRLDDLSIRNAETLNTRWPLDDMLGADFVQAARTRIESAIAIRSSELDVDPGLWLSLDSFSLLQALIHLAGRLHDEFAIRLVQLRLQRVDDVRAHLDLIWSGPAVSGETVMGWELDPMSGGAGASPLTIRDVVARHGGEFWFERDRVRQQAFFRFLLPQAAPARPQAGGSALLRNESRPEFFDFDLFGSTELGHALEDRPLALLAYTVFDTETTGLDPSGGDEIIQIGAARVVNGKLLNSECFEQLIDPKRSIPAASIPIHGITPDQLIGQPTLDAVLPAFRAYADETVLVAHNAAFDMRFLQLKEAQTGVVFDLPVLDTLLLSAVVHPNQTSHRLEAIAERFGITVIGRHTALGDAMVTAEVLIRLIPLLADRGITTFGQARAAAQETWFARLKY